MRKMRSSSAHKDRSTEGFALAAESCNDKPMERCFVVSLGFVLACYTPTRANSDATNAIDATCASLACGAHAHCVDNACMCDAGFATLTAAGCSDIDECAATGACASTDGQCVNSEGSFECYTPATCAAVKAKTGSSLDGDYTLYINGDGSKPWKAYCAVMDSVQPLEYLTVTPANENLATYKSGGTSTGSDVITIYQRLRLDPMTLRVATADQRFTTSIGNLNHNNTAVVVNAMPYATAMSCLGAANQTADAFINLVGSRFHLDQVFTKAGNAPGGAIRFANNAQKAAISGGGNCGWHAPAGAPTDPFNQRGTTLQLVYQ